MPVSTNYTVFVPSLERRVVISTDVAYEGQVVATFSKVERIMSDVWDDVFYAVVAEDNGSFKTIHLGCSEFGLGSRATVDAPESAKAAYQAYLARLEQLSRQAQAARVQEAYAREAAARAAEAARVAALPKLGDVVVVAVDGRCRNPKVKAVNGKSGKVFWSRDGRYGVALSNARDARGNFTNVVWCRETQIRKAS